MSKHEFVICINNCGYEVSLETRKLYEVLVDHDAEKHNQLRVIDESGEDYLYPTYFFDRITLPSDIADHVLHASA
ncbi:MAG: hypothetical protein CTY34_11105 [Methylobacter sp.]|nr:MAG: hypothetical protein CTY34_11105 [Methylobacter sp.]